MIRLKEVTVEKYKVFTEPQQVAIEDDITALVGLNESGKTAFLETLTKLNYFEKDNELAFNPLTDFPRNKLKEYEGEIEEIEVVVCKFEVYGKLLQEIKKDIGEKTLVEPYFYFGAKYNNWQVWRDFEIDISAYLSFVLKPFGINLNVNDFINSVENFSEIPDKIESLENPRTKKFLLELYNYIISNSYNWTDPLKGYIAKKWFKPNIPLFWYFDEYYSLPSRIRLDELLYETPDEDESLKTTRALFKLAKIDIRELMEASNFEKFIAELENTANIITEKIYKYWSTNKNLELEFEIEIERRKIETGRFFKNTELQETKYLNIRIRDKFNRVSLPLHKRSKGFNWFFSFIIWFSQIEKTEDKTFVLLLDEPGLNLHAIAQRDLLLFLKDLSKEYQLIYTTHSPFMIERQSLSKIRTISEDENGSYISIIENETNFETLLPIQAAIGYEIADNLLVKKRNLIVQSIYELILIEMFSEFLNTTENKGLAKSVSVTPLGGLTNIIKFSTLMSGYQMDLLILSETIRDETTLEAENKLGKVVYYSAISDKAFEIIDLFDKNDFLKYLYVIHPTLKGLLDEEKIEKPYSIYIEENYNIMINIFDFSNAVVKKGITKRKFSSSTFRNFTKLFELINHHFGVSHNA